MLGWRDLLGWGLAPMGRLARLARMGSDAPAGFWSTNAFEIALPRYPRNVVSTIARFMSAGHPADQKRRKTAMLESSISGDAIKYPCPVGGFLPLKIIDFKKAKSPRTCILEHTV